MNVSATAAAVWSSIAATISAAAALVALGINRANLHQSVKPELHLLNWSRVKQQRGELATDTILIGSIKNFGRGAALHVHMNLEGGLRYERVPLAIMSTVRSPLVPPDGEQDLGAEISLFWSNVKEGKGGGNYVYFSLAVYCWDTINRRHKTIFNVMAVAPSATAMIISDPIVPGVQLSARRTTSRSVRSLKLQDLISRLPGLGSLKLK